jgi:hypothetical protein
MSSDITDGMDEPTEDANEYDGFLSYSSEWHSLSLGVFDGMKTWRIKPKKMRDNRDVEAEPHYYSGGYVIGTLIQLIIVVVTGSALL